MAKLKEYVANAKTNELISGTVVTFVENFIRVSFETQLDRLAKRHYMHLFSHWVAESCFVESANKMLSYGVYAPKPGDAIHNAVDKTIKQTDDTLRRRMTTAHENMHKTVKQPTDRTETMSELLVRNLSTDVDVNVANLVVSEWEQSKDYRCCSCAENDDIESRGDSDSDFMNFYVKYSGPDPTDIPHVRPVYRRTRRVVAQNVIIDGKSHICLRCSCAFFLARKTCCRHIYSLIKRPPSKDDIHPALFKTYEVRFAVDDKYTRKVSDIIDQYNIHRGVLLSGEVTNQDWIRSLETYDQDFFENTISISVDVNPNSRVLLQGKKQPSKRKTVLVNAGSEAKQTREAMMYQQYLTTVNQVKDAKGAMIFQRGMASILNQLVALNTQSARKRKIGDVATTGQVDMDRTYNRKKPIGSPSREKGSKKNI